MKNAITPENVKHSLEETICTLQKHFSHVNRNDSEHLKLANEYYKWTSLKTNLILNEKSFQIPPAALPNTIKSSSFQWLHPEKQAIILKYYQYDKVSEKYIISVKKITVPDEDIDLIMHSLVLIRKAVVWVDFGFNIGTEFGGIHPAIILKNLKTSLIVIPLSSQTPKNMTTM